MNINTHLVRVAKPDGPLERALSPAVKVGRYMLEGFFDRQGNYFERITRRGRGYRREWYTLAPPPAARGALAA